MKRLIIHPGYSKTATTFLQAEVFPSLPGIDYLGKLNPGMASEALHAILIRDFFGESSSNYSLKVPGYSRAIADYMLASDADVFLLSLEELQDRDANVVNKAKKYNTNTDYNLFRLRMLTEAVAGHVGGLRVDFMITLREQKSFLASNYAGTYPVFRQAMYNFAEVDTFSKFIEKGLRKPYDDWFGSLFFDEEVSKYENAGMGVVKVFVYEDLKADPRAFLREMFGFLGVEDDPERFVSRPRHNVNSDRRGNLFLQPAAGYGIASSVYHLLPERLRLHMSGLSALLRKPFVRQVRTNYTPEQEARIDDLYRESNRKISRRHGLSLETKGYSA